MTRKHCPPLCGPAKLLLACVLTLLCAAAVPCWCAASPLAGSASVLPCVGTALDPSEPPNCLRKLVVDLMYTPSPASGAGSAAADGSVLVTSAVDTTLVPGSSTPSTVSFGGGGLRVDVSASALSVEHPLTYQREYEVGMSLRTSMAQGTSRTCAQLAPLNLCPGYTRMDGSVVSASAGRCCSCTGCTASTCAPDALMLRCPSANGFPQTFCLAALEMAFSGYGIGAGSFHYPLSVRFSGLGLSNAEGGAVLGFDVDATVSGNATRASASVGGGGSAGPTTLSATAEGLRDAVAVGGHVLFAPAGTASTAAEWVVLPASLVTVDGGECDKVGVSAETYYARASTTTCSESRLWCLHNQLLDFVSADMGGRDASGSHMASSMGTFAMSDARDVLVRTVQDRDGAVTLRWTASADSVAYVADPSVGVIDAAERVVDAATGRSSLSVTVRNRGVRASWYGVRVASCTGGVSPDDGVQRVVLDAGASAAVSIALSGGAADGATVRCAVSLTASNGLHADDAAVTWRADAPTTTTEPPTTTDAPTNTEPPTTTSTRLPSTTTSSAPDAPAESAAVCAFTDLVCIIKVPYVPYYFIWLGIAEGIIFVVWLVLYFADRLFPCWCEPLEDLERRLFQELLTDFRPQIRAQYIADAAQRGEPRPVWSDEEDAASDTSAATTAV